MKTFILIILVLSIMGCITTFQEVSQPFLDKYGEPELTDRYLSSTYQSITWYWLSRKFAVMFAQNARANFGQWYVDHTYSFK